MNVNIELLGQNPTHIEDDRRVSSGLVGTCKGVF